MEPAPIKIQILIVDDQLVVRESTHADREPSRHQSRGDGQHSFRSVEILTREA